MDGHSASMHSGSGSGVPLTSVDDAAMLVDSYMKILSDATRIALKEAEDDLHAKAQNLDGWRDIAGYLHLTLAPDGFIDVLVDPEGASTAFTLEYGNEYEAPRALIRPFIASSSEKIGSRISQLIKRKI